MHNIKPFYSGDLLMGILSIYIEWIKCVPAPWAIHAMCHMAYSG